MTAMLESLWKLRQVFFFLEVAYKLFYWSCRQKASDQGSKKQWWKPFLPVIFSPSQQSFGSEDTPSQDPYRWAHNSSSNSDSNLGSILPLTTWVRMKSASLKCRRLWLVLLTCFTSCSSNCCAFFLCDAVSILLKEISRCHSEFF